MKAEHLYGSLKNLAERLDVTVAEQNLSTFKDLKTRSGLCRVKGSLRFILDKRLPLHQKNALLAECLASMPHETLFIAPAVREFLQKHAEIRGQRSENGGRGSEVRGQTSDF